MKGLHIYERMSNPTVIKTYMNMIKSNDIANVKILFGNITLEAHDHPRYPAIKAAYEDRLQSEDHKE